MENVNETGFIKKEDVIKIIDGEISIFDYRSFSVLDELYKIREKVVNLEEISH